MKYSDYDKIKIDYKREEFAKYKGTNIIVKGKFIRFGHAKKDSTDKTTPMLLAAIQINGEYVCDHVWVQIGDELKSLELDFLDVIEFESRVSDYVSSLGGRGSDFKIGYNLKHVKNPRVVEKSCVKRCCVEDIVILHAKNPSMKRYQLTAGQRAKLGRKYTNYESRIAKLAKSTKITFMLERIDSDGTIHFFYSPYSTVHFSSFISGAKFCHGKSNKIIIFDTYEVTLSPEDFQKLSRMYHKVTKTKCDVSIPFVPTVNFLKNIYANDETIKKSK